MKSLENSRRHNDSARHHNAQRPPRQNPGPRRPIHDRSEPRAQYHRREPKQPQQTRPPLQREEKHIEPKPAPVGSICSPSCPLFRCDKKALVVKLVSGKPQPFCVWVNDSCIAYKCQYAFCTQRYLLPDGKCSAALRNRPKEEDAFMKELEKLREDNTLRSLLSRKGLDKDLLY